VEELQDDLQNHLTASGLVVFDPRREGDHMEVRVTTPDAYEAWSGMSGPLEDQSITVGFSKPVTHLGSRPVVGEVLNCVDIHCAEFIALLDRCVAVGTRRFGFADPDEVASVAERSPIERGPVIVLVVRTRTTSSAVGAASRGADRVEGTRRVHENDGSTSRS